MNMNSATKTAAAAARTEYRLTESMVGVILNVVTGHFAWNFGNTGEALETRGLLGAPFNVKHDDEYLYSHQILTDLGRTVAATLVAEFNEAQALRRRPRPITFIA